MSSDNTRQGQRESYGNHMDLKTEEQVVREVNATNQESGDGSHEGKRTFREDAEDDDGFGDDVIEDYEMDGFHEDDEEAMDDEDEEIEVEGEGHGEDDELEGEEDHEMEHEEKHEHDVEPADMDAQEHAHQTEEENKAELSYSTRGRTTTSETVVELSDHGIRDLFEELGRAREAVSTGASFLDALSEEERRTRTRFLPDVEGIHQLRKHEVKSDLVLARTLIQPNPVTATRKPRGKRNRGDDDGMEDDEEEGTEPPEEEKTTDSSKVGTMTIDLRTTIVTVPSNALVAPPPLNNGSSNGESSEGGRDSSSVPSSRRWHNQIKSPLVIESITAFNPPRPPESVGGKKKHRMLRWERRPTDIEDDLNIYRKTVHRTRDELQSAERERERIETVSAHVRRHFLGHLAFMNEEGAQLGVEFRALQQDCMKAVDLLNERVMDRHARKSSQVMHEALSTLQACGALLSAKGNTVPISEPGKPMSGLGGISSAGFLDWDRSTTVVPTELAASWILPGDKVTTPYGKGTVVRLIGASLLDTGKSTFNDSPYDTARENGNRVKNNGFGFAALEPDGTKSSGSGIAGDKDGSTSTAKLSIGPPAKGRLGSILAPRVCVRLPFGIGYIQVGCVSSTANPSTYSDALLAQRWSKLAETSHLVGESLDVEGMTNFRELVDKVGGEQVGHDGVEKMSDEGIESDIAVKSRLLPFGAGLLPTSSGRGGLLSTAPVGEIETGMQGALYKGSGVLGKKTNEGVPALVREWEDLRQEKHTLKAKVLQLRNELLRQRRTRVLNDRTSAATKERCQRIGSLMTEMRSDLNTLKERLDDELVELGIGSEMAENLLRRYFNELDESLEENVQHSSEDYGDGFDEEAKVHRTSGKARAGEFSDEEDSSRITKKARVGQ